MKKFKTESQRVLDIMINSIYTHKEIFLRELLSNCSDAIDKLYYKSLTGGVSGLDRNDFSIEITADKENRTLKICDNGIGMTAEELDGNLGVIARSGSLQFKNEADKHDDVNIIGQFGVGFYSAFMVAKKVEVLSRAYGSDEANVWLSNGTEGYEIKKGEKSSHGTEITLYIKEDTEDSYYGKFLDEYELKDLIKKYSDYIRYPIKMAITTYDEKDGEEVEKREISTINSMTPLWKKNPNEVKKEEYDKLYKDMFYDAEEPILTIHTSAEGAVEYKALLYIPTHAQYNYYSKGYEKGIRLYTNGVLITDTCKELIPDHFSFVKGLCDSELTLNISRETIQHDKQLQRIAKSIEKKIKSELKKMLDTDRERYLVFFKAFGLQLKYGIYENWGKNKELLQDIILFHSAREDKLVTLSEYVEKMAEGQKYIYYATGSSIESIKNLPQLEKVTDCGYDVLCMTDAVDEFAIRFLGQYEEKEFRSVSGEDLGIKDAGADSEEYKDITAFIKESLGDKVAKVRMSSILKNHPVCLTSEGELSIEMEKVLNSMPNVGEEKIKATKVLEINVNHPVAEKIKHYYNNDQEKLKLLSEVLFTQALLIEGVMPESPTKYAEMVVSLLN